MNVGNINQKLMDEGGFGKYFHVVLNMCDDDLDPYSYRLLGHYRRVCGMNGSCNEAIKTTARKCQMSLAKARATRQALKTQGYINFDEQINGRSIIITIIDRMEENIQRYVNAKKERAIKSSTPIESDRPTPIESDSPGLPDSIYKEELGNNSKEPYMTPAASQTEPKLTSEEVKILTSPTPIRQPTVSPKLPPVAGAYTSKNGNGTAVINPPAPRRVPKATKEPKAAKARQPRRSDPLWNAIADVFFQGARNGNQRLGRILFGKADHGLFGLIAFEVEHQNCTEDKLDYKAMATWVPKFHASLPKDNSGKTIELRDQAKFIERWIGWRETTNRIECPPKLFYDPNCPHHCDKGRVYSFDEHGMQNGADDCICVTLVKMERDGVK